MSVRKRGGLILPIKITLQREYRRSECEQSWWRYMALKPMWWRSNRSGRYCYYFSPLLETSRAWKISQVATRQSRAYQLSELSCLLTFQCNSSFLLDLFHRRHLLLAYLVFSQSTPPSGTRLFQTNLEAWNCYTPFTLMRFKMAALWYSSFHVRYLHFIESDCSTSHSLTTCRKAAIFLVAYSEFSFLNCFKRAVNKTDLSTIAYMLFEYICQLVF